MGLGKLFERQMGMYMTYHRDPRNRATHFLGIPLIVLSVIMALSMLRFGADAWVPSAGIVVVAAVWGLWLLLDWPIGAAMGVFVVPATLLAEYVAVTLAPGAAWGLIGLFFFGGWAFQLVGHVFEGRRPALLTNLFQALIGPMFLAGEVLHALGFRRALYRRVEALASEREARHRGMNRVGG